MKKSVVCRLSFVVLSLAAFECYAIYKTFEIPIP